MCKQLNHASTAKNVIQIYPGCVSFVGEMCFSGDPVLDCCAGLTCVGSDERNICLNLENDVAISQMKKVSMCLSITLQLTPIFGDRCSVYKVPIAEPNFDDEECS